METETYMYYLADCLKSLFEAKPDGMEVMSIEINHLPRIFPKYSMYLYGGIDRLADELHRPVRIEVFPGAFYERQIVYGDLVIKEVKKVDVDAYWRPSA